MTADDDDRQVGRILGRREMLGLIGGASIAVLAECAPAPSSAAAATASAAASRATTTPGPVAAAAATSLPSCIVRPALTEGPYFVDEKLNRSDIRSDPASGGRTSGRAARADVRRLQSGRGSCAALSGARGG